MPARKKDSVETEEKKPLSRTVKVRNKKTKEVYTVTNEHYALYKDNLELV